MGGNDLNDVEGSREDLPSPGDLHHGQVQGPARARGGVAGHQQGVHQRDASGAGNLWFDWSRSLDDPTEYVLVEAFRDEEAGGAHVRSAHFKQAIATLPPYLVDTPRIVSQMVDQDDWSELAEMRVE